MDHILLAHALIFDRGEAKLEPPGCVYDVRTGAWVFRDPGEPLVARQEHPRRSEKSAVEAGGGQKEW